MAASIRCQLSWTFNRVSILILALIATPGCGIIMWCILLLRFYETMRSVGEVCPVSCTRVEALSALNTPLHVPRFLQLSSVDDVIPALTRHLI